MPIFRSQVETSTMPLTGCQRYQRPGSHQLTPTILRTNHEITMVLRKVERKVLETVNINVSLQVKSVGS